jgi:phospholipase C
MKQHTPFLPMVLTFVMISWILIGSSLAYVYALATSSTSSSSTLTPIKHFVIIFQENVSFDHYFATYPHSMNGANGTKFTANTHTPSVNGLSTSALLTNNPNSANPYRLDPSQQRTCDITHSYTGEQKEYNGGLIDKFVQFSDPLFSFDPKEVGKCNPNQVMGYYDGNAVTALH